jgi:hypothetical protein
MSPSLHSVYIILKMIMSPHIVQICQTRQPRKSRPAHMHFAQPESISISHDPS